MWRPTVAAAGLVAALTASACGPGATPIASECIGEPAGVVRALAKAPAAVTLGDGSRLSRCIADGTDDAELQNVGITFHNAAEDLRVQARDGGDAAAAVRLGYLIGATRLGAKRTNGVMLELQRRIELVGGRLQDEAPALAAAVDRGVTAGEKLG